MGEIWHRSKRQCRIVRDRAASARVCLVSNGEASCRIISPRLGSSWRVPSLYTSTQGLIMNTEIRTKENGGYTEACYP